MLKNKMALRMSKMAVCLALIACDSESQKHGSSPSNPTTAPVDSAPQSKDETRSSQDLPIAVSSSEVQSENKSDEVKPVAEILGAGTPFFPQRTVQLSPNSLFLIARPAEDPSMFDGHVVGHMIELNSDSNKVSVRSTEPLPGDALTRPMLMPDHSIVLSTVYYPKSVKTDDDVKTHYYFISPEGKLRGSPFIDMKGPRWSMLGGDPLIQAVGDSMVGIGNKAGYFYLLNTDSQLVSQISVNHNATIGEIIRPVLSIASDSKQIFVETDDEIAVLLKNGKEVERIQIPLNTVLKLDDECQFDPSQAPGFKFSCQKRALRMPTHSDDLADVKITESSDSLEFSFSLSLKDGKTMKIINKGVSSYHPTVEVLSADKNTVMKKFSLGLGEEVSASFYPTLLEDGRVVILTSQLKLVSGYKNYQPVSYLDYRNEKIKVYIINPN